MGYRASAQLEEFILEIAPPFEATDDAPSTYESLCAVLDTHQPASNEPVPVYAGGCDGTIFSRPEVNHALRAWHDLTHYNESLDFSLGDEVMVARQQVLDAESMADAYDLTEEDINVLWIDLAGQRAYYEYHGVYVQEQDRFVEACLKYGIDGVLRSKEIF